METAIKFGHDAQSVKDVGELIREIVHAPTGERVKIAAFEAMQKTLGITNASISGCHIIGSQDTTHNHYAEPDIDEEFAEPDEDI